MLKAKNRKKILLTLGTISATIMPIVTVVSCGSASTPKPKTPNGKYAKSQVVSVKQVPTSGSNSIPAELKDSISQKIDNTHYLIGALDSAGSGIYSVSINADGNVKTSNRSIYKAGSTDYGWSQKLNDGHYLINSPTKGTNNIHVTPEGVIDDVSNVGEISGNENGFIQKMDNTHYFYVGYAANGTIYTMTINAQNVISTPVAIPLTQIPIATRGFSQKIDNTHYLIGTQTQGVYQVTMNTNGTLKSSKQVPMKGANSIPNVQNGWSRKMDNTHYLIGTAAQGVYQITVGADGSVKSSKQMPFGVGNNKIPNVANGFAQQIKDNLFLIGTHDKGLYNVTLNGDGSFKSSTPVKMTGDNSVPTVINGWSQQIDATHYLIGTKLQGVYQVKVAIS